MKKITFYDLKIEIKINTGFVKRNYGELMYIRYKDLFCTLCFADNTQYTVEGSLKDMEDNLPQGAFIRCNKYATNKPV